MLPVMEKMEEKQGEVLFTLQLPPPLCTSTACVSFCAAFNGLFAEILIVVLPSPLADHCTWTLSRLEVWLQTTLFQYNRWWLVRSFQTRSRISTGISISCEHSPHLDASCLLAVENPCDWSLHYFLLIAVIAELCCVLQFVFFSVIAKLKSHHLYHQ